MDDPNITMEEYIRLEEEKARRHGRMFNWQTATFEKVKNYEDEDDCSIDFETEFPAIVFDNTLTTTSSDPTILKLNLLHDLVRDVLYDVLKRAGISSRKEAPVNFLTDPLEGRSTLRPADILVFGWAGGKHACVDLTGVSSLVGLRDNGFVAGQAALKAESSKVAKHEKACLENQHVFIPFAFDTFGFLAPKAEEFLNRVQRVMQNMAPLPATDQRHPWLRYQIEEYTKGIRHSYEQRLETIWSRPVNRVYVLDFESLTPVMRQDLAVRLRMVYSGEGKQVFMSHAWRRLFGIRAPLVRDFILEFLSTYRMSDMEMGLDVADTLDYWIEISSSRDFLGPAPSYVLIRDPVRRLCHTMIAYSISGRGHAPEKVTGVDLFYLRSMDRGTTNVPHLLAQYLFRHAEGRKSGARLSGGHFIRCLSVHFRLVSDEGLRGLQAWVAQGPERQQAATAGAHKDGLATKEVAQEIPAPAQAPVQAPPPPPPAPKSRTIFTTEQYRVSTWLISCMTQIMDVNDYTYQPFDSTLVGSSQLSFQRRVRPRTGDASTSAAPHTDAQHDP
ncbi:hypothetical protein Tco_0685728 [Tanacetum coccineum]